MEDGGERRQARGGSRQSRLDSRGDRNEDQKKPKVGHVLANEGYHFIL